MHATPRKNGRSDRRGQAMVELVAAVLCLLVLVAGLLQIIQMATADTDSMVDATARAAAEAAAGFPLAASTSMIADWEAGPDGYEQTKDDVPVRGSLATVQREIALPSAPDGDWSAIESSRHGILAELHHGVLPSTTLGLVRGSASRTVDVLPVARVLFGLRDPLEIRNEVWSTVLGGLY